MKGEIAVRYTFDRRATRYNLPPNRLKIPIGCDSAKRKPLQILRAEDPENHERKSKEYIVVKEKYVIAVNALAAAQAAIKNPRKVLRERLKKHK